MGAHPWMILIQSLRVLTWPFVLSWHYESWRGFFFCCWEVRKISAVRVCVTLEDSAFVNCICGLEIGGGWRRNVKTQCFLGNMIVPALPHFLQSCCVPSQWSLCSCGDPAPSPTQLLGLWVTVGVWLNWLTDWGIGVLKYARALISHLPSSCPGSIFCGSPNRP